MHFYARATDRNGRNPGSSQIWAYPTNGWFLCRGSVSLRIGAVLGDKRKGSLGSSQSRIWNPKAILEIRSVFEVLNISLLHQPTYRNHEVA
jgi:hypothetical protein